jgi:hypothetical protein
VDAITDVVPFVPFQKIGRLSRLCTITEKIDGTNACIYIGESGEFLAGSRSRWITPVDDNYGFAKWAHAHRDELMVLGPGTHYGEWWGHGIQRNYSQTEKRFSLFNTFRWRDDAEIPRPACCSLVPVLYEGQIEEYGVLKGMKAALNGLQTEGSAAAPGFMKPEGIVIYHHATKQYFKKTLEKDEKPKGSNEES